MSRVTFAHSGLPSAVKPFDLPDLVSKLRGLIGLQDDDVAYLRHAIRSVRSDDFLSGRVCAFWTSPGKLADELQVSPRQLNRIETRLEACGLIARTWGANRRRFGWRGDDGTITAAGGINLGPLIDRVDELVGLLRARKADEKRLMELRGRARNLIKAIRALDDEAALEAARAVFPRLRPAELGDSDRLNQVIDALAAVLEDFTAAPGRTPQPAASDIPDRPVTIEEETIRTCTLQTRPASAPTRTSPTQVLALASQRFRRIIALYLAGTGDGRGSPDWRCICLAARDLALQHGVSGGDWRAICDRLGEERAALALTIADRNADRAGRWKVENVAGTLVGLARAEAMGRALLESLVGEAIRSLDQDGGLRHAV